MNLRIRLINISLNGNGDQLITIITVVVLQIMSLIMNCYIIIFKNNKAVQAIKTNIAGFAPLKIEHNGESHEIIWMIIYASDEERGMRAANEAAASVISFL